MFLVRILPIAGIFLAANAWSADPTAGGPKGTVETPTGQSANQSSSKGKSESAGAVRNSVASDLETGKQPCADLAGQPRDACEARAAATAESPRGRGGADPTGTAGPARVESGPGK
jgi:hypothetical protein